MTTADDIKRWIEQGLANSTVMADGDGQHFEAVVICDDFTGKNTMARHRMVYAALGDRLRAEIHALSLKTYTSSEHSERVK